MTANFFNIIVSCHYDFRKFNFTNRVIPTWNSLSDYVVSADTVNTFKHRVDKFWSNQEVLYNLRHLGRFSVITALRFVQATHRAI